MLLYEHGFLLLAGEGIGSVAALIAVAPRLFDPTPLPWVSLGISLGLVFAAGLLACAAAAHLALRRPLPSSPQGRIDVGAVREPPLLADAVQVRLRPQENPPPGNGQRRQRIGPVEFVSRQYLVLWSGPAARSSPHFH